MMFSVGEFSVLAQVSKRLLRYYDEIGLLRPAYTDPQTGYRYYQAEQLGQLNRILVLKELGLSLEQIQRMLNSEISAAEMQGMLMLKKAEIEQTLQAELQRIRKIEARLGAIRRGEDEQALDVVMKEIPPQHALTVIQTFASFEKALSTAQQIREALPERSGYGFLVLMCHDEAIVEHDMRLEMGCLVENTEQRALTIYDDLRLDLRYLEPVPLMATTLIRGGLEFIHAAYGSMALWAEQHEYRLAGMPRELTLQAPQWADGRDLVTELQFPVAAVAG